MELHTAMKYLSALDTLGEREDRNSNNNNNENNSNHVFSNKSRQSIPPSVSMPTLNAALTTHWPDTGIVFDPNSVTKPKFYGTITIDKKPFRSALYYKNKTGVEFRKNYTCLIRHTADQL
jgi:hypothetical protein